MYFVEAILILFTRSSNNLLDRWWYPRKRFMKETDTALEAIS